MLNVLRVVQEMTSEAHRRVVVEYIKAVMQKRISFKNADERKEGAERMIKEAEQFKFLFRKLTAVRRDYTCRFHLEITPVDYTWRLHLETTPVDYTWRLHLETTPVDYTWRLHL